MAGWILFAVLLCMVVVVALIDLVPTARTWVSRIGMGSLSDANAKDAVRKVSEKWIRKTPSVPLSDQTRFTLPERIRGTYKSSTLQSWQKAALLLGVTGQKKDTTVPDAFLTPDGNWKNFVERADFALLGYAVLCNAENPDKIRPAMDAVYNLLQEQANGGTVPYNPNIPDIRFVDTLGMVCPFLVKYANTYHVPEAMALCERQMEEYNKLGMHEKFSLPVHCFRLSDGAPLGVYGWGRGCGWYALALAEMLRNDYAVQDYMLSFADSLCDKQMQNGAFSRQILGESCGESSCTAMIGHFMAVLYQKTKNEKYKTAAEKAVRFLVSCTRKNGEVDLAQGDTKGIGFYSLRLSTMPAAQGFTLLLMEEMQ